MKSLLNKKVGVVIDPTLSYPDFPYHVGTDKLSGAIKNVLGDIGLKGENPLESLIKKGEVVVVKPNWVRELNPVDSDISSLITHTSVIKIMIDLVLKALDGEGMVVVADAPIQGCNFSKLIKKVRILELFDEYRSKFPKVILKVVDLRKTVLDVGGQRNSGGDPLGYSLIDLGSKSLLSEISEKSDLFRVTMYDHNLMYKHHNRIKNEYLISNTVLTANVIINIPKMKCHIKAGLTGALKNLVGINGHKEYLPHHVLGSYSEGGDQYIYKNIIREWYNKIYDYYWSNKKHMPIFMRYCLEWLIKILALLSIVFGRDSLLDGGWSGNQTISRTTIDLNNILYFYDLKTGEIVDKPVRKVLNIVDGVVAGEGEGPLSPSRKNTGVLIAGFNPLYVDIVMGHLMGYCVTQISTISFGMKHKLSCFSGFNENVKKIVNGLPNLNFVKPKYWRIG